MAKATTAAMEAEVNQDELRAQSAKAAASIRDEEREEIFIPRAVGNEEPNLFVSVNGVNYLLRHAVAYGMPERDEPQAPETGGDFWAEIVGFTRNEFACPCPRCGGFPVEPAERLVRVAVQIREHFGGKPVIVSSGVRCQAHNAELPGSSPTSRHMRGLAMDFAVRGVPVAQVLAYTQQLVAQGVVRYTYEMKGTGYVHIDVDE